MQTKPTETSQKLMLVQGAAMALSEVSLNQGSNAQRRMSERMNDKAAIEK